MRCVILAAALAACSPGPAHDPVVVILRDGLPACAGFAVGRSEIITAAHCVGGHDRVAFVTADQWVRTVNAFTVGSVVALDEARDIAAIRSAAVFEMPLRVRPPLTGEAVRSRSLMFEGPTAGVVLAGDGFFRVTDMTIALGWSGSPVIGADGAAVGFVHACEAEWKDGRVRCLPHSAVIGVLP